MKLSPALLLFFLLSACTFPLEALPTATPNITQAYETIDAEIKTRLPAATKTALTEEPIKSIIPTGGTPTLPPATQAPPCSRIQAGIPFDVTIPDNTLVSPGEVFYKTWRLINSGSCAWTKDYTLALFSGEPLSKVPQFELDEVVNPGQSIDITIEMTAPEKPGTYQSNWVLLDPDGKAFGIGPAGNAAFWARIIVPAYTQPAPTPTNTYILSPSILSSGTIQLQDGAGLLLSNLSMVLPENADLSYLQGSILPGNKVEFSASLGGMPEYATCLAMGKTASPISINNEIKYHYFCFIDANGHIGWLQVLGENPTAVDLEILTWEK